jgi:hypothetical protein
MEVAGEQLKPVKTSLGFSEKVEGQASTKATATQELAHSGF